MEKPRFQKPQPAQPDEFKETFSMTREQLKEEDRALTGGDPEVEAFLEELSKSDSMGIDRIHLEELGITGKSILTLYELTGRSFHDFGILLAAVRNSTDGDGISAFELLNAIDRAERGESASINIPAIVEAYTRKHGLI